MIFKKICFISCLFLSGSIFAGKYHSYNSFADNISINNPKMLPGYCEIEVINNSFDNVTVFGTFEDGSSLNPFNILSLGDPQYISLYYNGYCHPKMSLDIVTFNGYHIYSQDTLVNTTVKIVPYIKGKPNYQIINQ